MHPAQLNPAAWWSAAANIGMVMIESQAVIAMRVMGMAGIWSVTPSEDSRMVSEKIAALTRAATESTRVAMAGGSPDRVAAAAIRPIRQTTRANMRRLSKRGFAKPLG